MGSRIIFDKLFLHKSPPKIPSGQARVRRKGGVGGISPCPSVPPSGARQSVSLKKGSREVYNYSTMLFGQKPCPDCAPAQVNHAVCRTAAYLSLVIKPLLRPLDYLTRVFLPPRKFSWFDIAAPKALRALAFFRIGALDDTVLESDSDRTRCLWVSAKQRGIELSMFRCGPIKDLFIARHCGETRCFDGLPRPVGPEAPSLYWMDNKALMRKRFAQAVIPVARGGTAFTKKRALTLFRSLAKPVIVKPYSGSRSRHTTIHLETENEFLKAFRRAKQLSPLALIEEELEGFVHRGTLIGGKLAAVLRREPPHVIGNGKDTVAALVAAENKRPERHGHTFQPIATGAEAEAELVRQKLDWRSVPARGAMVTLNQKISRGVGASNTEATERMHPENRALLEKIGALLADPLVGVDFIMRDVAAPWQSEPRSGVIECNSLPFIDLHHYPLNGAPRNVAGALWDLIFPDSSPKKEARTKA